ncbi:MAG: hypothetical protein WKF37_02970 [Bryobacteraceae bacterium]
MTVQVTNLETGVLQKVVTNEQGFFNRFLYFKQGGTSWRRALPDLRRESGRNCD